MSKPWYTSKTVIVNALTFLAMALSLFVDFPATARYAPWLTLAITLLNLVLRASTTGPITLTRKDTVPPGVVDLTPSGEIARPGEIVRGVPALPEVTPPDVPLSPALRDVNLTTDEAAELRRFMAEPPEVTLEPGPDGPRKVENFKS